MFIIIIFIQHCVQDLATSLAHCGPSNHSGMLVNNDCQVCCESTECVSAQIHQIGQQTAHIEKGKVRTKVIFICQILQFICKLTLFEIQIKKSHIPCHFCLWEVPCLRNSLWGQCTNKQQNSDFSKLDRDRYIALRPTPKLDRRG